MKKVLLSLMALWSFAFAFDMGAAVDSVDKPKAGASVDMDKVQSSVMKGDISIKAAKDSVDGDKAIESVDKDKLMKAVL